MTRRAAERGECKWKPARSSPARGGPIAPVLPVGVPMSERSELSEVSEADLQAALDGFCRQCRADAGSVTPVSDRVRNCINRGCDLWAFRVGGPCHL